LFGKGSGDEFLKTSGLPQLGVAQNPFFMFKTDFDDYSSVFY
jgi:hypothetical protein